jgi:cell filamentation protein
MRDEVLAQQRWHAYFYPPPHDDTLRNKYGVRDFDVLRKLEYRETSIKLSEARNNFYGINASIEDHVKNIHRTLFQNIYLWAGEYRTVNMSKDDSDFADIDGGVHPHRESITERINKPDFQSNRRFCHGVASRTKKPVTAFKISIVRC